MTGGYQRQADRPAPEFDKGTLARTLIGLYGQVTSLPDRRKAYGSSPLVKFLRSQRYRPEHACGHRRMQVRRIGGTGSLAWATGPQFPHRGTYAAYRSSKAALNALTVYYAHALADDGIKVNALAPGLRRTDLNTTAAASDGDPAEAAAGAVRLALLPDDGPSGEFFSWDGTQVPW